MKDKIKIDIVSDVVCPWCVVGYKRLQKAIDELGVNDKIEIEFHPFELNPNLGKEGKKLYKHLSDRYGMSIDEIKGYHNKLTSESKELGFYFDFFEDMNTVDTRDAHILLDYAKDFGKQIQLKLKLFSAHFEQRKNISDIEVLAKELEDIGLDSKEALKLLNEESNNKIAKKEYEWQEKGVSAVPTMVFENNTVMNGAYPIDTYKEVLREILGLKLNKL